MLLRTWPRLAETDLVLGINIAFGGVIARLASPVFYVPYITFAYAYEFLKFPKWSPPAWLLRDAHNHAKAVIAISRFTRDNLVGLGVDPARIAVVHPGATPAPRASRAAVRATRAYYALGDGPVILAVGRFVPRKGHRTLVQAMPRVLERAPEAVLVLVGRGPFLQEVVHEAYAQGVREHVLFPGALPDKEVARLYEACTLFALPTGRDARGQVEGFGLAFAEAQAHGKPVVGGRSGGVVDVIRSGETGLLVDPDDPCALADAVLGLIEHPKRMQTLARQGRKRVESELNWTQFAAGVLQAAAKRL